MSSNTPTLTLGLGIEAIKVMVEVMVNADQNEQKRMVDEYRAMLLENQQTNEFQNAMIRLKEDCPQTYFRALEIFVFGQCL